MTEWELLNYKKTRLTPKDEHNCKAALSKSLNDLLKEQELPCYDCINVTKNTLEIRFAVRDLSYIPNIDALSTIVKSCFDKHKPNSLTVKKGRIVSR